uniref:Protein kinase domain-containing protein n=1 Tax=Meloidogyne javanica TaxID=6303 RepID=A0A915MMS3_MELJA
MFTVLELGGMDLLDYFHKTIIDEGGKVGTRINEELLIKIIRGAAKALEQFHKLGGIHGDIKRENFVISLEQSVNEDVIECKLIDFNTAVLDGQSPIPNMANLAKSSKAPEIYATDRVSQKADIWAFGLMVYELFNNDYYVNYYTVNKIMSRYSSKTEYNTKLDRVIKACAQSNPLNRPTIEEIVQFLNGEIEYFEYELLEMERLENERLEEQRRKDERRRNRRFGFCFGFC